MIHWNPGWLGSRFNVIVNQQGSFQRNLDWNLNCRQLQSFIGSYLYRHQNSILFHDPLSVFTGTEKQGPERRRFERDPSNTLEGRPAVQFNSIQFSIQFNSILFKCQIITSYLKTLYIG